MGKVIIQFDSPETAKDFKKINDSFASAQKKTNPIKPRESDPKAFKIDNYQTFLGYYQDLIKYLQDNKFEIDTIGLDYDNPTTKLSINPFKTTSKSADVKEEEFKKLQSAFQKFVKELQTAEQIKTPSPKLPRINIPNEDLNKIEQTSNKLNTKITQATTLVELKQLQLENQKLLTSLEQIKVAKPEEKSRIDELLKQNSSAIDEKEKILSTKSATAIQKITRGRHVRKEIEQKQKSASTIQRAFKKYQNKLLADVKTQYQDLNAKITQATTLVELKQLQLENQELRERLGKIKVAKPEEKSPISLLLNKNSSAIDDKEKEIKKNKSATAIQKIVRGRKIRQEIKQKQEKKEKSTIPIIEEKQESTKSPISVRPPMPTRPTRPTIKGANVPSGSKNTQEILKQYLESSRLKRLDEQEILKQYLESSRLKRLDEQANILYQKNIISPQRNKTEKLFKDFEESIKLEAPLVANIYKSALRSTIEEYFDEITDETFNEITDETIESFENLYKKQLLSQLQPQISFKLEIELINRRVEMYRSALFNYIKNLFSTSNKKFKHFLEEYKSQIKKDIETETLKTYEEKSKALLEDLTTFIDDQKNPDAKSSLTPENTDLINKLEIFEEILLSNQKKPIFSYESVIQELQHKNINILEINYADYVKWKKISSEGKNLDLFSLPLKGAGVLEELKHRTQLINDVKAILNDPQQSTQQAQIIYDKIIQEHKIPVEMLLYSKSYPITESQFNELLQDIKSKSNSPALVTTTQEPSNGSILTDYLKAANELTQSIEAAKSSEESLNKLKAENDQLLGLINNEEFKAKYPDYSSEVESIRSILEVNQSIISEYWDNIPPPPRAPTASAEIIEELKRIQLEAQGLTIKIVRGKQSTQILNKSKQENNALRGLIHDKKFTGVDTSSILSIINENEAKITQYKASFPSQPPPPPSPVRHSIQQAATVPTDIADELQEIQLKAKELTTTIERGKQSMQTLNKSEQDNDALGKLILNEKFTGVDTSSIIRIINENKMNIQKFKNSIPSPPPPSSQTTTSKFLEAIGNNAPKPPPQPRDLLDAIKSGKVQLKKAPPPPEKEPPKPSQHDKLMGAIKLGQAGLKKTSKTSKASFTAKEPAGFKVQLLEKVQGKTKQIEPDITITMSNEQGSYKLNIVYDESTRMFKIDIPNTPQMIDSEFDNIIKACKKFITSNDCRDVKVEFTDSFSEFNYPQEFDTEDKLVEAIAPQTRILRR